MSITTNTAPSMTIAIVILSWNGRALLERFLPSVLRIDHPDLQIYVADNASTDDSIPLLKKSFPTVQIIELEENFGFGPAYNQAVEQINSDVTVLLNNDVEVSDDWLFALIEPFKEDPRIGVTGSKLYFPDGKTLQHAGAELTYPQAKGHHRFYREADVGQADQICDVDYVTGASMAVHRRVLDAIGLFDDSFAPMYFEEVDFCYRVRQAGFRVVYVPESVAVHHESMSIRGEQQKHFYFLNKNRLYFVLKHYSQNQFLEEFVPAEENILAELRDADSRQIMRQIYFEMVWLLPNKRTEFLNDISLEAYQDALLDLAQTAVTSDKTASPPSLLTEFIFPPPSGKFRQAWHSIAGEWAIRKLRQQQNELNQHVLKRLDVLAEQDLNAAAEIAMLVKEMSEIQSSLTNMVLDLSAELADLQAQVAQLEQLLKE